MITTLVLPQRIADQLSAIANGRLETAGVLLVSLVPVGGGHIRLLGREFYSVPEAAYLRREVDALTIASDGYVGALSRAEVIGAAALWVHTHPGIGSSPAPSKHDDIVDQNLAETFRVRSGTDFYGTLILTFIARPVLGLQDLRWIADSIPDCHVIAESLAPASKYDGERRTLTKLRAPEPQVRARVADGLRDCMENFANNQKRAASAIVELVHVPLAKRCPSK